MRPSEYAAVVADWLEHTADLMAEEAEEARRSHADGLENCPSLYEELGPKTVLNTLVFNSEADARVSGMRKAVDFLRRCAAPLLEVVHVDPEEAEAEAAARAGGGRVTVVANRDAGMAP